MHQKISVIIPAANEERFIARAIRSVQSQLCPGSEIIVVVNGSKDMTADIARAAGARVIVFDELLGYGRARNEGAKAAGGDIFVFMDADSFMGKGALETIARETRTDTLGAVRAYPDSRKFLHRIFYLAKNIATLMRIHKGALGGLLFCYAGLYRKTGGYDEKLNINEHADFVGRAEKNGGKYLFLTGCSVSTSMRRFEKHGALRVISFWIRVGFLHLLHRRRERRIGKKYMSSHDKLAL